MANKAVLLINLGSPDDPSPAAVKRYLDEFLMDPYVVDLPYPFRFLLVKGIILNTRPKRSAAAYQKVWTKSGSPLIVISETLRTKVAKQTTLPVYLGMRYGSPSIDSQLQAIYEQQPDLEELCVMPLYPQYAMSTTLTVEEEVVRCARLRELPFKISSLPPFYNNPDYLSILVDSFKAKLAKPYDHLLFSFHGLPERHLKKSDCTSTHCLRVADCCRVDSPAHANCYKHQCEYVAEHCATALNIPRDKWTVAYQSRLGLDPWIKPYTDDTIEHLAEQGVKRLVVVCPAFVSDCLETLEEINLEAKEEFIEAGGEDFGYIPCLNTQESWCATISNWIESFNDNTLHLKALK